MPNDFYLDPRNAEAYDGDMGRSADAMQDVPFYLELARKAAEQGEPVLELGCGTGRVTVPIAQAGVEIVGLDNAPAMLDVARRKAEAAGIDIRWITDDMANFRLEQRFGLVIIPYRSFLHLLTEADQLACLSRVYEHLRPGGRFALNFFVPPIAIPGSERPLISLNNRRMRLRYVSKEEMESLLERSGFEIEALYGGFNHEPFKESSTEMVWLARRTDRL
jgi:SAM-dependent methyltransferase